MGKDPDLKTSCGVEARAGHSRRGLGVPPCGRRGFPPAGNHSLGQHRGGTAGSWREAEGRCSSEAGGQMAEAVGLAHMVSRGLGPERGPRGPRTTGRQDWGVLLTDLLVMKLSPRERLRGDWPAQPP